MWVSRLSICVFFITFGYYKMSGMFEVYRKEKKKKKKTFVTKA